jgi:hypothetical protein
MKRYLVILKNNEQHVVFAPNWYEAKKQAWQKFGTRNILSVKLR